MQFYCIGGGGGGSQNQSVSAVTTIFLTQCNTSPSHRVDQVVDCGLCNVGPLLFNDCVKVLDIGRNWNTLSHNTDPEHPKHAQWETGTVSMLAMQELGCFQLPGIRGRTAMGPCIIKLQHEVMVVDEGHNNGPYDLVTLSLCIQNAINKMHLCLLSITHACPYHNPTATMGHSSHNLDISKPFNHTMPYTLSAICPVQ